MGSQNQRPVAALLAYFLGSIGVDDFYVGNTGLGVLRLAILIGGIVFAVVLGVAIVMGGAMPFVTMLLPVFIVVLTTITVCIWALINTIRYLVMTDEKFQQIVSANQRS